MGKTRTNTGRSEINDRNIAVGGTPDKLFIENAKKLKNSTNLKNVRSVTNNDLSSFLSSSLDHKTLLLSQWEDEKKISKAETETLRNTVDLLRITESNTDLVTALSKEGVNSSGDLVKYSKASLADMMVKNKIRVTGSKDISSYAGEVLSMAEAENPSAFFMYRIMEKPDLLEIDASMRPSPSSKFKDFYNKNKDFDLKNEPILSPETGQLNEKIKGITKPTPDLIKELSNARQSLLLSSDSNMAALLLKNEINIQYAVTSSNQKLMRQLGVDEREAEEIKQKAQFYHEAAMNGYLAFRDIISNPFLKKTLENLSPVKEEIYKGIVKDKNWAKVIEINGLKDTDTIEDLFGSQNYCECESCRSVLSPAAYFVDLMKFTEQRVLVKESGNVKILPDNHPIHLKVRRPDLWKLELSCENTNKSIPYVEIINEVLSAFTGKHLGTGKTVSERLVEEQPDLEFLLPYNQYLDEVRVWLSYFGLTRLEVLEYLYPSPDSTEKLMIAIERLNLSKEQYDIIINQSLNAKADTDVLDFRLKSGLSPEDTELLTKLHFWDNKLSIVQKKDPGDIQKFHIEFKSSLPDWQGKLHRLIRLWRFSGWSLNELDILFKAFNIRHNSLNKDAIIHLASFKKIQGLLQLNVDVLVGILKGVDTTGADDSSYITWKKLLPPDWKNNDEALIDDMVSGNDDDAFNLLLKLQGAFGVSSADLLACFGLLKDIIGSPVSTGGPVKIVFNTNTLNIIYRYIQLYKWSGTSSFETFVNILGVWGNGTVKFFNDPAEDIPSFVKFLESFSVNKIGIEDLIYLFGNELKSAVLIDGDKDSLTNGEIKELVSGEIFAGGDKFALLFNKWTSADLAVLPYYRGFMEITDAGLNSLFSDLSAGNPSDATCIELSNLKKRIERLEFLMAKYKISVDKLKEIAEEAQTCTYPKLGFSTWQDKEWVKELACLGNWIEETESLRNFDLWDTLQDIEKTDPLPLTTQKAIAKWKKIDVSQVPGVVVKTGSITFLKGKWDRIDWAVKLNINSNLLDRLKTNNSLSDLLTQSNMLQNAIRSKFNDNETWESEIQDFKNRLSSNKRDALCNFVIFNKTLRSKDFGFDDREDLYRYFLLDVSMGDCFMLPRMVAATNSLQVYIHRCMMGLEQSKDETVSVLLDIDEKEEWEWRKNYRVWEANRKIFLFPENYIEPEIRDNKSPEFIELEDELLQQKLSMEVVENAYKKYIQQIMTLAELKIAGAYHDKDYNTIYLFGKTNRQPVEYYYRNVEFPDSGGIIWSNWEKMNVAIPAEDISAIRYNGKLYVFWTTFQRKDISDVTNGTQEIKMHTYDVYANYSYLQVDNKWSAPQRIELNYRKSSPFDPFLRFDKYKNQVVSNSSLKPEASEIRENVLKEFERTVYRKPYPVETQDRNLLQLDYIWTDKKNALVPVYKNTRAIIDAFTKKIKIRVILHGLAGIEITPDIEFSFNRFDQIVYVAGSDNQSQPPANLTISPKTITIYVGVDKLEFIYSFTQNGTKYSLKTGNSAGNYMIFFKENDKEIASGDVDLQHRIDYVPVNVLDYERNLIKIADQKKVSSSLPASTQTFSLKQEYNIYYDSFNDFYVTDGTNYYADGVNDFKIQQRDLVAILTTPDHPNSNDGHNLNPEYIQMLWDKISLSIDDLLDYHTQRHLSPQIDYSRSFGNYFYELFFHIPVRIAEHLNAAGKYREANLWYSYIYNPTALKDQFEQLAFPHDVNWRFAAFRNITIKKLKEIYGDPNAIEVYRRNPGNPHAIARLRIGAYQKNVVMKYLDNLMDWGDYLFEQYTPESTSEARHLYNMVKTILGDKPESVGKCKETKALTYSGIDVNSNSDFIYNLFTATPAKTKGANIYIGRTKSAKSKKAASYETRTSGSHRVIKGILKNSRNGGLKMDKAEGRPSKPNVYYDVSKDLIFCFPHNKDFIQYWDRVNDRIFKLNNCMDINGIKKLMPAYAPEIDPALLARMVAGGMSFDEILAAISGQLPNHRFAYLVEKAKQVCSTVQSFGSALFSAIEKKDGEELTLLRARHEQNILALTTKTKKRQIDLAKTNHAGLLENKTNAENRKTHYEEMIEEGLIEWEEVEQIAKWTSGSIRIGEGVLQLLSGAFRLVPQLGSPFAMKYGGLELGDSANRFANALEATAKIADNIAILAGLEGSYQRRDQEWKFQLETVTQELKAIEEQVRASEISVTIAEHDLELHNKNVEQYQELYEFYTNKFSGYQHYTFQVQQLQKLYKMAFNLANDLAIQAQQAFEFERFGTQFNTGFIQPDNWNTEKAGLLAGERLMLQLMQMEKEYHDTDKRKNEITQHFSMQQIGPDKLYQLKATGECADFTIPEAAFDLTYPGYFRRIIRSVRITIPCIAGPYTNIGATLALGNNKIRKDKNSALADFSFGGRAMIATSNAQNDGGQFELNFRDERYLPFEGAGAVSSWTLSLPKARPAFDYSTISDVIFHISYTADYDGTFKDAVETNLIAELNKIQGAGLIRAFSLRHDFPNEWHILSQPGISADVILELKKEHFPYFTNIQEISGIETQMLRGRSFRQARTETG